MAHVHDHGSTVVTDREGMSSVLIAILAIAAIVFLVWFFAFSGVVFDRGDGGGDTTRIEQQNNPPPVEQPAPGNEAPAPDGG